MTDTYKPIELKGGKDTASEGLYGQIGNIKGNIESIDKSIIEIKDNLARLWNKFDLSQSILHQTAKDVVEGHEQKCPLKIRVENLEQNNKDKTVAFRWFVNIMLSIIAIVVSIIAIKGWYK